MSNNETQTITIVAYTDEHNDLTGECAVQIEGGIQLLSTLPKSIKQIVRALSRKLEEKDPGKGKDLRKMVIDQIIKEIEAIR